MSRASSYPIATSAAGHIAEHNWLARRFPTGLVTPGGVNSLFDLVAEMDDEVVIPPGTWTISETLEISGNQWITAADHTSELLYTGGGYALLLDVPPCSVNRLPGVRRSKTWDTGADTSSVGVRVRNTSTATFHVGPIYGFGVGLDVHGDGAGSVSNTFHLTSITDNKVGLRWSAANGGWSNQNTYIGGAVILTTSAASGVIGSRYVQGALDNGDGVPVGNGNTLIGVNLEGNRVEKTMTITRDYNSFVNCRFEGSPGVEFVTIYADRNQIIGGYGVLDNVTGLVATSDAGGDGNVLLSELIVAIN